MSSPESSERRELTPEAAKVFLSQCRTLLKECLAGKGKTPASVFFQIAAKTVELSFTEAAFQEHLLPALNHLKTGCERPPDFVICLAGPGKAKDDWMRSFPDPDPDHFAEGFCVEDDTGRAIVFRSTHFSSFSYLDPDGVTGLFSLSGFETLPAYERGAPLRVLLYWMLRQHGIQLLHSACVGTANGSVLIAGRGGAGKSVTSLKCLLGGMLYAGDDYIAVDPSAETPLAYSLFSSAKVFQEDLKDFPEVAGGFVLPESKSALDDKAIGFITEMLKHRLAPVSSLRGLLLPVITGNIETSIEPLSRFHALRELAPSTLLQFPGAGQEDFQRINMLVSKLPCYRLGLGTDPKSLVRAILRVCGVLEEPRGHE